MQINDEPGRRTGGRVLLGRVAVDSGILLVADPGYLYSHGPARRPADDVYKTIGEVVDSSQFGGIVPSPELMYGLGVAFKLESDGTYPVVGVLRPDRKRLARVVIDLKT